MNKSKHSLDDWLKSLENRKAPDGRAVTKCWKLRAQQEFDLQNGVFCPVLMKSYDDEVMKIRFEYAGNQPKRTKNEGERQQDEFSMEEYQGYRFSGNGLVFVTKEFTDDHAVYSEVYICVNSGRFKAGSKK